MEKDRATACLGEQREEVYLQLCWRRDELTDQLHLAGSIRIGVKRRSKGKKEESDQRSSLIPQTQLQSLANAAGSKASTTTDRDAQHLFCMHLQREHEHAKYGCKHYKHADTAWGHKHKQTGTVLLSL